MHNQYYIIVVVQLLSHVQLFVISWTAARHVSLASITFQSLLKFMFTELVMQFNHLILCSPLLILLLIFPLISLFE